MATGTHERTDISNKTELATKADLDKLATKADLDKLATKADLDKLAATVAQLANDMKWIKWILGAMVVLITAMFAAVLALSLQI